ncbi:hypothetical protein AC249_AIPGENE4896 [Exaiptasia diaphana]|nr:hypothetical protein AC249_AIPGENE4896 [Exaiptasia diaphana]
MASVGGKKHVKTNDGRRQSPESGRHSPKSNKILRLESELNERNTHEQNLTTTIKELNLKLKQKSEHEMENGVKEKNFKKEMDKLNAKVTELQSDREAENKIITSQEHTFKEELDKLNAKVAELQRCSLALAILHVIVIIYSELQTKHFEEKIWYTVFANLTDKLKRLESIGNSGSTSGGSGG